MVNNKIEITGNKLYYICDKCNTEIIKPIEMTYKNKKEVICPVCGNKINL